MGMPAWQFPSFFAAICVAENRELSKSNRVPEVQGSSLQQHTIQENFIAGNHMLFVGAIQPLMRRGVHAWALLPYLQRLCTWSESRIREKLGPPAAADCDGGGCQRGVCWIGGCTGAAEIPPHSLCGELSKEGRATYWYTPPPPALPLFHPKAHHP